MKFTASWLRDHLDTDASAGDIAERLVMLGHDVEGIEPAEACRDQGLNGRIVGPDAELLPPQGIGKAQPIEACVRILQRGQWSWFDGEGGHERRQETERPSPRLIT